MSMALIACPECGGKVSDKAKSCPHCGFPIEQLVQNIHSEMNDPAVYETIETECRCPYCDALIHADDEYCDECGMRLVPYYQAQEEDSETKTEYSYRCLRCKEVLPTNVVKCPNCHEPVPSEENLKEDLLYCPTCGGYNEIGSTSCIHCGRKYSMNDLITCVIKAKQNQANSLAITQDKNVVRCRRCGSTSITYVNKRLSVGRAVAGQMLMGAPGAILGGLSSKKGKAKCLKCGYEWKI